MKKNYIIDTNVFLYDADALFKFEDNNIIIPLTVIEEVDHFKKEMNEVGRNARRFSKYLDEMREINSLADGVPIGTEGGTLRVEICDSELIKAMPIEIRSKEIKDNLILSVALDVKNRFPNIPTVFVSKDTNLRIKSDSIGIKAEDYEHGKIDIDELYTGTSSLIIKKVDLDRFHGKKGVSCRDLEKFGLVDLYPNQFITLINEDNPLLTAVGIYKDDIKMLQPVQKRSAWELVARNSEQACALELLMDDKIKLVTLVGKAGTGKTLLAIAAGLQKTADESVYNRLLVSRPVFPMGKDLGFLPGSVEEKLGPWMQPIFDNVDLLVSGYDKPAGTSKGNKKQKTIQGNKNGSNTIKEKEKDAGKFNRGYKELLSLGLLEIEPLTYIRGRSIPFQYLILDEAQNLSPLEIKTVVTRVGEGTKIVVTGDPYQIDNPYVDSSSNGLTYLVERFKNEAIAGHITMKKGERSHLAELASNLL